MATEKSLYTEIERLIGQARANGDETMATLLEEAQTRHKAASPLGDRAGGTL